MNVELIGYHGTSKDKAKSITKMKLFNKSTKNNEWLGHGIYFYELFEKAEWWSKNRYKNNDCVLESKIIVDKSHYCNLDIPEKEDELFNFIKELEENGNYDYLFRGDTNKRRCDLFNLYSTYKDIHVLGATLLSTNKKGKNELSNFGYQRTEKQYCVYNEDCIRDINVTG